MTRFLRCFVVLAIALPLMPEAVIAQVFFAEDFNDGNAASRWTVSQIGGANLSNFAFDYGAAGIPTAPNGTGSTGLRFDVNTSAATPLNSAIMAFPNGQNFTAGYTLAFDLWFNVVGTVATTEFGIFGGGHTSTTIQAPTATGGPSANGIDFALTGDEGAGRDVRAYVSGVERSGTTAATAGGYARSTAATQPQDEYMAPYFFSYTGDAPENQWLEMAVTITSTQATWTVNGNTWARTNATIGTGNIMLGYMDIFATSIAPLDVFSVYDNVRVTAPVAQPTELKWSGDGATTGGSGTWVNLGRSWLGVSGSVPWNWALPAVFEGTSGTVSIDGAVTAGGGLRFLSDGYTIQSGTLFLGATSATDARRDSQIFDSNASTQINVPSGLTATIASAVRGRQGLTKTGTGTLVLQQQAGISGTTLVSEGTLRLESGARLGASSNVRVAGGATLEVADGTPYVVTLGQQLGGSGTMVGDLGVESSGRLQPGMGPGNLTVTGAATFGDDGVYNWQILDAAGSAGGSTGWDLLTVGGVLDIAVSDPLLAPFQINLWSLSSTGPDVSGSAVNFSPTQNYTWTIATAAGGITNFSADKFRINVSATNGSSGFANALGGGTFSLAQSGNNLNLLFTSAAPPVVTINVATGTQTQTQAGFPLLSGTTPVQKTGTGTVVFTAANTLTGPTTVAQGTLVLGNAGALASSAVTVAAGAKLAIGPQVAAVVPALVNNGLVDVGLGSLTITAGQGAATLVAGIVAGRADGTWTGTSGITSSAAATQGERAVGWLDNGDGSFTVGYAAAGDWNVNGVVDFDDVVQFVSAGRFDTGLPATWAQGDYDYNGVVDFDDVLAQSAAGLFDAGPYNAPPGGMAPLALGDPAAPAGGLAAVPEPATWVLVAVGAACAAGRRCRLRLR